MSELSKMINIGKQLEKQLEATGINTPRRLIEAGSRGAWLGILAIDESACINRLYALEGAVSGIHRHQLDEGTKAELKGFYRQHKGKTL